MIHDYKTPSMTVFIALVTRRPTTTVDPIRPITLHLARLIHQTVRTEEVGSSLSVAVPVLGAVELVGVPAVFLANADVCGVVVGGSAVCVIVALFAVILVAVLVALVAHLAIATVDSFREVALDEVGVVQQLLPVLGVAHHVGSVPSGTVPVLPAVELVGVPPVHLVRAVHEVAAVFSSCCVTSVVAVVVALVTDRTLATVGVLLEVAPTEDEVINLRFPCRRIVRADVVFPLPLEAMPVLPTVEGIREVSVAELLAVGNSPTVRSGCWCRPGWLGRTHSLVFAGTRSTFDFVPVATPVKDGVVNPGKSIGERFTLLMSDCPFDTVVVEGAGLGVRLSEEAIGRATGSTWHLAGTLGKGEGWQEDKGSHHIFHHH